MVRITRVYRRWQMRAKQRVTDITVQGGEHLRSTQTRGDGVLITPNHATHYDSNALYLAADQLKTPLYFMTAWQVFSMSSWWERWLMQRMGCFSIDRESADRAAYKQGVEILRRQRHPLVIFPEGDIYHSSDRVMPFRDGAAAIAISAARRGTRPISIVPCAVKFTYVDDPLPHLQRLMTQLEDRIVLKPEHDRPLHERIYRFADALLAIKEIEYQGGTRQGSIRERIMGLAEHILGDLECRHAVGAISSSIPERVKLLRQKIIRDQEVGQRMDRHADASAAKDLDDVFFVMQLYSYPSDYLHDNPSVERLAETLDKLEEDVLDLPVPSVRGRRRVAVSFGPPIPVPANGGRGEIAALTARMHGEVQRLVNELGSQKHLQQAMPPTKRLRLPGRRLRDLTASRRSKQSR